MSQTALYISKNGGKARCFPLTTHRVALGASPDCDLSLDGDQAVHDYHALLRQEAGRWQIEPIEAAVMLLDGTPLERATPLARNMPIRIGSWHLYLDAVPAMDDAASGDEAGFESLKGATKVLAPTGQTMGRGPFVLRWQNSAGEPQVYKLKDHRLIIGKSDLCDIVIADDYMSARHCELYCDPAGYVLRDLGSTNGTFVNGLQIKELHLEDGTEITCGTTKFVFAPAQRAARGPRRYPWSGNLLGTSPAFERLTQQIERVAALPQNVFIHGETGTGKELVAAALHELSLRKERPLIALNCGAISKELMESELFGHEKGAFTGAQQRRIGAFELANGGTLFLDEVGELPLELQPKLLRVLETGRFRRVGGRDELKVDVRVFSATHRDLADAIRMGRFREDLYYRLYILPVELPALRERLDDVAVLVEFFVAQACPAERPVDVSRDVYTLLKQHNWPGNIRELRNLVYRALAFCDGTLLKAEHFTPFLKTMPAREAPPAALPGGLALSPIKLKEREAIVETLRACEGNQSLAAKHLGIGRTTLYYKIKEYGIDMRRQAIM